MTELKKTMKKTVISVRAYCCDIDITLRRHHYLTIEDAEAYVSKEGWDTAMVIGVKHIKESGEVYLKNERYQDPTQINFNYKLQAI
jgi:hypothetical protein